MDKDDEEKIAFHTSQGVYCYTKMPFGLKNAGATYQRLVDNAFEGQVGRNLEVYVDDLVIKSHTESSRSRHKHFLGYLIKPDGIKPIQNKQKAFLQLPVTAHEARSPVFKWKVRRLTGSYPVSRQVTSPCSEHSRSASKKGDFRGSTAARRRFSQQLKQHIAALPTLVAPRPGEELIMYLSATHGAISVVLLTDRDSVQTPVYFVSKALKETEINYSAMEKLIMALVFAAKRLRRYFQAHPIVGMLPHEQKDARRIRRTAQRFKLRNGVLYRRSFLQPWLRCVGPIQADYVLREIHAGSWQYALRTTICSTKSLRSGYYWPTMHRDARDMIKKCNDCQVHRPIPRHPQQELTPITSPWPFHKWGIDIAGPFPVAAGGLKFLIVAIDYFT
ncbi:reverse transcriptase domain-containing protein [Tanacetum coccineum]